jgi:hypothetical protein
MVSVPPEGSRPLSRRAMSWKGPPEHIMDTSVAWLDTSNVHTPNCLITKSR